MEHIIPAWLIIFVILAIAFGAIAFGIAMSFLIRYWKSKQNRIRNTHFNNDEDVK